VVVRAKLQLHSGLHPELLIFKPFGLGTAKERDRNRFWKVLVPTYEAFKGGHPVR
jgi:hypothetical protein